MAAYIKVYMADGYIGLKFSKSDGGCFVTIGCFLLKQKLIQYRKIADKKSVYCDKFKIVH